jgi:hypothetical protein
MARYPSFVGPSYRSQSKIADDERCVNWYPEKIEAPNGKADWVLYPTPGFELYATAGSGPIRGFYTLNGRTFVVSGSSLYEIASDGSVTLRGTGLNDLDGTPVTICGNGDGGGQLFITSGSKGYIYNLTTNVLAFEIDGATQGGFIDGFFLALDPQTSTLKISELEDGSTWDPLQIAQRNAGADRWAGMIVSHKEIWLFGSQTTEVWYNAGASPFPFQPNPSVFINHGILAPYSAAILDNAPIWLGQSTDGGGIVYRANGYTPQRVSTHALEYALSTYDTLLDAQAWTYQEQGHSFYVLTFPDAGVTWVYDVSTGAWHERGAWTGTEFTTLPVFGHTYAYGLHLTGDSTTGAVYRMGVDLSSDGGGRTLRRLRRAPHLSKENTLIAFDKLQLDLEVGLGLATGQGEDPQIMLRWSNDGGQTWGNEHWVSGGLQGAYRARAIWRRLGAARDRVFEVSVTDPIPWRIIDAWIDVRGGSS